MDFIGNIGYLYMIKKGQNQCFVAKMIATLLIPHNVTNLATLKPILDAMFLMKVFMEKKNESLFFFLELFQVYGKSNWPSPVPKTYPRSHTLSRLLNLLIWIIHRLLFLQQPPLHDIYKAKAKI